MLNAVYISATQFKVAGDYTNNFTKGTRVLAACGVDGYLNGSVESVSYSLPDTTITLMDAGFTSNLTAVSYGSTSPDSTPYDLHNRLFGGRIWYVNDGAVDDTNTGRAPDEAFKKIGTGIAAMSAGDALVVKAGTYTETGLDLNKNACEFWAEIGTLIEPATGTGLVVSGNYCKIKGQIGITVSAGNTGMSISGAGGYYELLQVFGGATGYLVTGENNDFRYCASGLQTATGYDVQAGKQKFQFCATVGTGASSYGFKMSNNASIGIFNQCSSVNHAMGGYYFSSGSAKWTILGCSSGSGDGRWYDAGNANVWSNFSYDDEVYKDVVFSGAPTTYNIYKVTGSVRITNIDAHVETIVANTSSKIHLELYSTGGTVGLSNSVGAPDLDSLPVDSFIIKKGDSSDALEVCSSAAPCLVEYGTKDPEVAFVVTADAGQDTFIRINLTAALGSGELHWHCNWEPLTGNGFLEPA